jgi:hypothetical protein
MTEKIKIGRLLRAGTTGFVAGCQVSQLDSPRFGGLVRVPIHDSYQVYGIITDIHIDDDGIVRQLVTADGVDEAVIADNRVNRNIPIEISVLTVGYEENGHIRHMLPPRPPLSLDEIFLCTDDEITRFTPPGQFGYFRHITQAEDISFSEVLAAHLEQAQAAHIKSGDPSFISRASQEIITLLRDDYPSLMTVLGALSNVVQTTGGKL